MTNTTLIFLASVGGILLYLSEHASLAFLFGIVALLVAGAVTFVASRLAKSNPVASTWLFTAWRAIPLAIIFLAGYGSAALAVNLPALIALRAEVATEDMEKVASSLIIASINTFLGAIVLDTAKDPESWLWPGVLQRRAWKAAFDGAKDQIAKTSDPEIITEYRKLRCAYGEDRTFENEVEGWGFGARLKRARIIVSAVAVLRAKNIEI